MGKKNNKSGSPRKKKGAAHPSTKDSWNFLPQAGPGCYIVRRDQPPDWILEWEDVDPEDFHGEEVPDVAIDPEEQTLSFCNVDSCTKVAYITVFETKLLGVHQEELPLGSSTDNQGVTTNCATFILLCPPHVFVHLCFLDVSPNQEITEVRIESDVQEWQKHPNPHDEHSKRLGFPLEGGPFLCTQGENGRLTHFFSGNLHAIDFQCPIGTPLIAVADGVVAEAMDSNTLTGIAVMNLFDWNSILIRVEEETSCSSGTPPQRSNGAVEDGPLFVEYVHIQKSNVQKGDRVTKGQVIGWSGSVGFSPEPHLHFSAFRSCEPTAPTVRVRFEGSSFSSSTSTNDFLPKAGYWYDASGLVDPPSEASTL